MSAADHVGRSTQLRMFMTLCARVSPWKHMSNSNCL